MAPSKETGADRRLKDVNSLLMSKFKTTLGENDSISNFHVRFTGPPGTPFENGVWNIHVELPNEYPFKSPSIGFTNRIFHPNIDELSGSVCLDVINQSWSPMYALLNIFESFLPQLLTYPNASDPLNGEAAALYLRNEKGYEAKVREYVQKYATEVEEPGANTKHENDDDDGDDLDEDDEMSSVASFGDEDEDNSGDSMTDI